MPHRQVVLALPKRLRAYCLYRRRLLGDIARVAARTVTAAIRTLTGEPDLAVGIVACQQTHGSRANWHPPLHLLVTDGGFRPDGSSVPWPAHDTVRLTEAFRRAVLRLFVRRALFDEDQAAGMLAWPHSGFHVHTAVWVPEDDRAFATRLARYCARNPVALERMTYDHAAEAVTYRSDKSEGPTAHRTTAPSLIGTRVERANWCRCCTEPSARSARALTTAVFALRKGSDGRMAIGKTTARRGIQTSPLIQVCKAPERTPTIYKSRLREENHDVLEDVAAIRRSLRIPMRTGAQSDGRIGE